VIDVAGDVVRLGGGAGVIGEGQLRLPDWLRHSRPRTLRLIMIGLGAGLVVLPVQPLGPQTAATGPARPALVARARVSGDALVLAPDGTPVSGGIVFAQGIVSPAFIDSTGRFRLVTMRSGAHQFLVRVPGLVPYRVDVTVPDSRSLRLPVIRLASGVSVRVRL